MVHHIGTVIALARIRSQRGRLSGGWGQEGISDQECSNTLSVKKIGSRTVGLFDSIGRKVKLCSWISLE